MRADQNIDSPVGQITQQLAATLTSDATRQQLNSQLTITKKIILVGHE